MIAVIGKLISLANTDNAAALVPAIVAVTELRDQMTVTGPFIAPNQPDGAPCAAPQPVVHIPPQPVVNVPLDAPVIAPSLVPVTSQRVPKVSKKQRVLPVTPEPAGVTKNLLEDRRPRSHKRIPIDTLREPTAAERDMGTFKDFAKRIHHRFTDTDTASLSSNLKVSWKKVDSISIQWSIASSSTRRATLCSR
jgi:hypothetical protein